MTALHRRCAVACTFLALTALNAACSFDRTPIAGACVYGRSEACTCDDGSLGANSCTADGVFGACSCAAPSAGGQGANAVPPIAGSAGIGGSGAGSEPAVAAGASAPPVVDAGGVIDEIASDAMTPNDDAAIDASAGANDASIIEPLEPGPGEAYGACRADGSCNAPLFCAFATLAGTETYCTMFCSVSGLGQLCPDKPSGNPGSCVSSVCAR